MFINFVYMCVESPFLTLLGVVVVCVVTSFCVLRGED